MLRSNPRTWSSGRATKVGPRCRSCSRCCRPCCWDRPISPAGSRPGGPPAVAITVWANGVGLVTALVVVLVLPAPLSLTDVGWGLLAGTCGSLGAVLLYRALALGVMSLVAPVTAASAAVIPVAVGAGLGERLSTPALVGVARRGRVDGAALPAPPARRCEPARHAGPDSGRAGRGVVRCLPGPALPDLAAGGPLAAGDRPVRVAGHPAQLRLRARPVAAAGARPPRRSRSASASSTWRPTPPSWSPSPTVSSR